jgi:hypothetical protein
MSFNPQAIKAFLKKGEIKKLFIEGLGWDVGQATKDCEVKGTVYSLRLVAAKAGFKVWHCEMPTQRLPSREETKAVHRQLVKESYEHIIIFSSKDSKTQSWLWVRREVNKPISFKHHLFNISQDGESLTQKLRALYITFEEEESGVNIVDVTKRAKTAFDVEKVTKKFYQEFDKHRKVFLGFIDGIPVESDREWYASVMLNRLMFAYFIQKKGFLDSNPDYLKSKLKECQAKKGEDKFYSFYRIFLLRLFHEGLGMKKLNRPKGLEALLGNIPYLNGGMFDVHELEQPERYGKTIEIKDEAFEKIFAYFDQYQWHLDERPLKNDKEINPDVLGYIFEKYINQKQMGAYYTKEDITEYISKNTIIPFLLDAVRVRCGAAFDNSRKSAVWGLLRDNPDRYIYEAVRHGSDLPLPKEIEAGVDVSQADLVERRKPWGMPAPPQYALPSEIWREVVARRKRFEEVRRKLVAEEVCEIRELITLNLDLRQFAQDVIQDCESPDLLIALWQEITTITVLDPTGGSGAFIFAALNILEPLYEACLDRMEGFLADWEEQGKGDHPDQHGEFQKVLARVVTHPNRRYFVLKSIIVNNLYAVDIMEEAVEICKLRLFLKLASQVEPDATRDNLGIEPLPDIDFNIRAGNTLIGYATYDEVKSAITSGLDFENAMGKVSVKAAELQQTFDKFRQLQTEGDGSVPASHKLELQKRLKALEDELNRNLAGEYGVNVSDKAAYTNWVKSHQPFHWFIQFYGILHGGGFDVIIGNPPYLEIREVGYGLKNYACLDSGAIHAMCMERSERLLQKNGCMSMIVPLSLPSTQRMQVVQELLETGRNAWFANYAWRPAKLFDTVNRALTIFVVSPSDDGRTFSTNYQKWTSDDRDGLMDRLNYVEVLRKRPACWIPKVGETLEQHILNKCLSVKTSVKHFTTSKSEHRVYYRTDGGLYWKVFTDFPPAFNLNGKKGHSSRETWFTLLKKEHVRPVIAALSSNVFWWWYTVTSNVRHLNPFDVQNFPLPESALADPAMQALGARYLKDLDKNSTMLVREQKQTGTTETQSFKIQKSKPILDEIDTVLAVHYGFTAEELDFILNYDIKYRLGRSAEGDEE